MNSYRTKKFNLLKIKSAISEFIIKTQKLVKSVEPDAEIVIPCRLPEKRKREAPKTDLRAETRGKTIIVPEFKKIKKSEISDNSSGEETDDHVYEEMHKPKEKLEILLRTCPELPKIKSGRSSTGEVHQKSLTVLNALKNVREFEVKAGKKVASWYLGEVVKRAEWPERKPARDLEINLP